jgi:hypothetical protein
MSGIRSFRKSRTFLRPSSIASRSHRGPHFKYPPANPTSAAYPWLLPICSQALNLLLYAKLIPQHTDTKALELENYKIEQRLSHETLDPCIRRSELKRKCEIQTL